MANARLDEGELAARLAPVILGGDVLAYSYARCLNEAYGVRLTVVSNIDVKITSSSKFVDYRVVPDAHEEAALLAHLKALGSEIEAAGKLGLLVGSADWQARFLAKHQGELARWFVVPYPTLELFDVITQKQAFYELCEERGVPYPRTWLRNPAEAAPDFDGFPYPLIMKPSHSPSWDLIDFAGKRKIYELASADEARSAWAAIAASGYEHPMIIQDFVPGADDAIRSLTCFCDPEGEVKVVSGGRVALQDHSPQALGNPVCIVSERVQPIIDGATALLAGSGYRGFANFDIKYDERDGTYKFFEVNARAGRNTFYMALGGVNFVEPLVESFVLGRELGFEEAYEPFCYATVPFAVLGRHVADRALLGEVRELKRAGKMASPLRYGKDAIAHKLWVEAYERRQVSKFKEQLGG